MQFKILTGLEFDKNFLPQIMELDNIVYESDYVGVLENMEARYEKNPDSFVCIMDEEQDRLAGYINFFPCTEELYQNIRYETDVIRDDDIRPDEVALYSNEGGNHLFVISMAVHPEYQVTKDAITALSDAWIGHLNGLEERGYSITDILAITVSKDGEKALRNYMFTVERELEDGNTVYVCENRQLDKDDPEQRSEFLKKLLEHDLYFKSYRSDIYLLLPLADNVKNERLDNFFDKLKAEDVSEYAKKRLEDLKNKDSYGHEVVTMLMEGLKDCINYEVSNDVRKELDTVFLEDFNLLHTTDDYPLAGKENEAEKETGEETGAEIVVGEEKMYAILTAHRPSHMYVLTLFLPDSPYSTTQVQDQLSYGYLKIRYPADAEKLGFRKRNDNKPHYIDFYEYIRFKYGLLKCGDGKTLLCLSGKPGESREFQNILSGEVYNSMHIDYRIKSKKIEKMCKKNHAQYDYYKAYLSDVAIAFILKNDRKKYWADGSETDKKQKEIINERIKTTATYAFIAQLVMFQNTSLAKTNIKISNALANSGDISLEEISNLYSEFGKTVRFWEVRNFKYNGTQAEAACITEAFSNEELKKTYYEHQEFLEHIVELKTAKKEAENGMVLNIVAIILAVIQIQDFAVGLLVSFYSRLGIEAVYAQRTFTTVVISVTFTILLIYMILRKKNGNMYRHNMMNAQKSKEGKDIK